MEVRRSRRLLGLTPKVDEFKDKCVICQGDLVIDSLTRCSAKTYCCGNACTRDVCNRSYNTQICADIAKPQILGGMKMKHNFHLGRRWYARGLPTQRIPSIGIGEGDGLIIFTIVILFRGGPCRTMRIFPSGLNFIQDSPSSCSKGETLPCTSMPIVLRVF